ncbi:MAG: hypothetical protein HOI47_29510 [Candidatus Scalindua sp.]|nr:hypothetical protein [Candidatus Scalindua sp.]MBT5304705.1 hypothetical protein [Candidatus Scalindua sp.]MBT6230799.1 hypothetical protein [Candidatus Scalindua sp.]MBT7212013.1 hypothetical protein [Candidatus Scalindua sp.]MBT7591934.1 hypothetical protein [Candidatus Scalindua sp.]
MKKIISLSIIAFFFIIYLTCYLSVVKADPPVTATQNVSGDSITQMPTSRDPWAVNSLAPGVQGEGGVNAGDSSDNALNVDDIKAINSNNQLLGAEVVVPGPYIAPGSGVDDIKVINSNNQLLDAEGFVPYNVPVSGGQEPVGVDVWTNPSSGTSSQDFSGDPIPPDFFAESIDLEWIQCKDLTNEYIAAHAGQLSAAIKSFDESQSKDPELVKKVDCIKKKLTEYDKNLKKPVNQKNIIQAEGNNEDQQIIGGQTGEIEVDLGREHFSRTTLIMRKEDLSLNAVGQRLIRFGPSVRYSLSIKDIKCEELTDQFIAANLNDLEVMGSTEFERPEDIKKQDCIKKRVAEYKKTLKETVNQKNIIQQEAPVKFEPFGKEKGELDIGEVQGVKIYTPIDEDPDSPTMKFNEHEPVDTWTKPSSGTSSQDFSFAPLPDGFFDDPIDLEWIQCKDLTNEYIASHAGQLRAALLDFDQSPSKDPELVKKVDCFKKKLTEYYKNLKKPVNQKNIIQAEGSQQVDERTDFERLTWDASLDDLKDDFVVDRSGAVPTRLTWDASLDDIKDDFIVDGSGADPSPTRSLANPNPTFDGQKKIGRNAEHSRPPEATWNQEGPSPIYKVEDQHIIGSNSVSVGKWSNVKLILEMGHKAIELPNYDPGTSKTSGGAESLYNIKDPTVRGLGWSVGFTNEPGIREINGDSSLVSFFYFNFTGFQGTETESVVVVDTDPNSGILPADGSPGGFGTNGNAIEHQAKFEVTRNKLNFGTGGLMKITDKVSFKGDLGVVGGISKIKVDSNIYTNNLLSIHDTTMRIREIGFRIRAEIVRALPYNMQLSIGASITPTHVISSTTVNDIFKGAGGSHYTTNESTMALNKGAFVKVTKELWRGIEMSASLNVKDSYLPELDSSKVFNEGSAIETSNGSSKEISGGIMFKVPVSTFLSNHNLVGGH